MSPRFGPHRFGSGRVRTSRAIPPRPTSEGMVTLYRRGVADEPSDDIPAAVTRARADEQGDLIATITYDRPTPADVARVASLLDLPPLLAEDLEHARQRPKVERHGDALFVVMKAADYVESAEDVVLTELHVVVLGNVVLVARHGGVHSPMKLDREIPQEVLALGPEATLYAVLDQIVDGYFPVLQEIETDVDEIERQVFTGDDAAPERIYRLSGEVIDLKHAVIPLREVVARLRRGAPDHDVPPALEAYLQDVEDHLRRATDRVVEISSSLDRIMTVNATLVGQRQNEDMKRISSWAAILFTPTLVAAIYGMNFAFMPELQWRWGYPASMVLMLGLGLGLYWAFKRRGWL
ncbi:magnesium transporter [Paraoerskovia marina]|uniref:Magnesium transporter n=1 Tax=Paraoerskovia marina TaxID=545619 RepID=A0A1H1M794_9CELL|nr:magnesium and cobalt transport protein CorA [Paraoerskovia marina]SDR82648.1 magnesium transporter [Paraoerskovia marina]